MQLVMEHGNFEMQDVKFTIRNISFDANIFTLMN